MKKQNKTNSARILLGLALVVIAVIGGWLYLGMQKTSLEITSDKSAYFTTDKPQVEIKLHNAGVADAGEITVTYDNKFFKIAEQKNTAGVTTREVDNKLIFTLSEEFFNAKTIVVSKLTLESIDFGTSSFEFDKTASTLSSNGNKLDIAEYKNKTVDVGVAPARGPRQVQEAQEGSIDSI
jgi:hypothetical protein